MLNAESRFMNAAIREAKVAKKSNNYAIGAIIERDGQIIAKSPNITRTVNDPTYHAEIEVIRKAIKKTGDKFLEGAVLYTTHEPCPMCAAACVWARLKGVVFGANLQDMIAYSKSKGTEQWRWRTIQITANEIFSKGSPQIELQKDFMRDECIKLFHSL
ncbi:MAG: nucleoside deaminase [Bacteroidales bacterium]|jgi:tRNA(Arg) A34 adenosine deaminase TadA